MTLIRHWLEKQRRYSVCGYCGEPKFWHYWWSAKWRRLENSNLECCSPIGPDELAESRLALCRNSFQFSPCT